MKIKHEFIITAFCILFILPMIANPGFFNHDELQKIDYIYRSGFQQYISDLGVFHVGKEFGQPIRPLSFIIQGVQGLFIYNAPMIAHFIDAIMHILNALMLFFVVCYLSGNKKIAFWSAILFSASPLTMFSVGWTAALMDRLFILFILVMIYCTLKYLSEPKLNKKMIFGILAAIFLGIASKETMIIAPLVISLILLWNKFSHKINIIKKENLTVLLVAVIPVISYLLYRLPAIMTSLTDSSAVYNPSFANIIPNAFTYWIYPFLPFITETSGISSDNYFQLVFAAVIHLILLVLAFKIFGKKVSVMYVVTYFLPLLPILSLQFTSSIYLYGSAIALSFMIAALIMHTYNIREQRPILLTLFLFLVVCLLFWHSLNIQKYIYTSGICMNRALISMESAYLNNKNVDSVIVYSDKKAPKYIMDRITFGRMNIGKYYPIKLESSADKFENASYVDGKQLKLHFSEDCYVY